jgi:hypothetical protein
MHKSSTVGASLTKLQRYSPAGLYLLLLDYRMRLMAMLLQKKYNIENYSKGKFFSSDFEGWGKQGRWGTWSRWGTWGSWGRWGRGRGLGADGGLRGVGAVAAGRELGADGANGGLGAGGGGDGLGANGVQSLKTQCAVPKRSAYFEKRSAHCVLECIPLRHK